MKEASLLINETNGVRQETLFITFSKDTKKERKELFYFILRYDIINNYLVDNDLYEISKIYRHIYFNCFLVFL